MDWYLQRLQEAIASATHGMDIAALTRRPEGKWCTAEVLEHLYLTCAGSVKGFERCLQEDRPLARTATFKERVATLLVTAIGRPPAGAGGRLRKKCLLLGLAGRRRHARLSRFFLHVRHLLLGLI